MVVTWAAFGPSVIVMGGAGTDGTPLNDVWQAYPTVAFFMWRQILANNPQDSTRWCPRANAGMEALLDTLARQVLIVTGGGSSTGILSDTWLSYDDGASWAAVDQDIPARAAFPVVAVNTTVLGEPTLSPNDTGRFYVLGGLVSPTLPQNDVWMLSDPFNSTVEGPRWHLVLASTSANDTTRWAPRFSHGAVLLRDRMLVFGGSMDAAAIAPAFDDVWVANASTSFTLWTRVPRPVNASVAFPFLTGFGSTVVFTEDTVVVAGGLSRQGFVSALLVSRDAGVTWERHVPTVANIDRGNATGWWSGRTGLQLAYVQLSEILVVSGGRSLYKATSDTWLTPVVGIGQAGVWEPEWFIADSSTTLTDYRPGQARNELDGRFAPRMMFGLARMSSAGLYFLVGGQTISDSGVGQQCRNDVWKSYGDYGSQWTMVSGDEQNASTRFRPRCPTVVVPLPSLELVVLPSVSGPLVPLMHLEYDPSTWITRDLGKSWELLDAGGTPTSFPRLIAHCTVGLKSGGIVTIAGAKYQEDTGFRFWPATNEVWASLDGGRTWNRTSLPCSDPKRCFQPRASHACIEMGSTGQIIMTGGQAGAYTPPPGTPASGSETANGSYPLALPLADTWASSDLGVTWTLLVPPSTSAFPARFLHAMASLGTSCVAVLGGAVTFIPGGASATIPVGSVYNDMWQYCTGEKGWTKVNPSKYSPNIWQPRLAHAASSSPSGDPIVLGGTTTPNVFSSTNPFDLLLNDVWIGMKGGSEWHRITHSWSRRLWAASASLLRTGMLIMGGVDSDPSSAMPDASVRLLTFHAEANGAQHVVAQLQTSNPPWPSRLLAMATSFIAQDTKSLQQHLYVLLQGGWLSDGSLGADVWRCDCGDVSDPEEEVLQRCGLAHCWEELPQSDDFPRRSSAAMAAASTRTLSPLAVPVVFLTGGIDENGHFLDDLWFSVDKGVTFMKHPEPAPWGPLTATSLVAWSNVFNVTVCAVAGLDRSYAVTSRLVCLSASVGNEWPSAAIECPWESRMSPIVFQPQSGFLCVTGGRRDFVNAADDGLWCATVGFSRSGGDGGAPQLVADWKQYEDKGAAGYGGIVMPIIVERDRGALRPRYFSLWIMGGSVVPDGEALVLGLFEGILSPTQDGIYRRGSNMSIEWYSFGTTDIVAASKATLIRVCVEGQPVHTIFDITQHPDVVLVSSYEWPIPRTWPHEWTVGVSIEVRLQNDPEAYFSAPVVITDGASVELVVPPSSLARPTPPDGVPLILANTTVQLRLTTMGTADQLGLVLMRSELSTNYLAGNVGFLHENEIPLGRFELEPQGDSVFSRSVTIRLPPDCLLSNRLVIRADEPLTGAIADTPGFQVRCAAGWAPNSNGTRCEPCPAGKFAAPDRTRCELCPVGTYADMAGAVSVAACKPCPIGTYGRGAGLARRAACTPCPPGMEGVRAGQGDAADACQVCPPGTFGNGLLCSHCTAGKFSNATGAQSPRTCQSCPFLPTTTTPEDGAVALAQCICSPGRVWNPSVAQSWEGGDELVTSPCASCDDSWLSNPDAFNCSGTGLRLTTVGLFRGFWRASAASTEALACPLGADACKGGQLPQPGAEGTSGNHPPVSDAQCTIGYRGPRCVLCASGWAPSRGAGGVGVPCVECTDGRKRSARAALSLILIVVIVSVCALVGYQVRSALRLSPMAVEVKRNKTPSVSAGEPAVHPSRRSKAGQTHAVSKLKIMLACLQIVALTSAITSSVSEGDASKEQGGTVGALLMVTNLSLSYLLGVGCAAHWTLYTEAVLFTALPLVVSMGFALAGWLLRRYRAVQYELRRLLAVGSFLLFPAISSVLFQVFTCVDLGDGEPRLVSSPSLSCSTSDSSRTLMIVYASLMLVLFAGGIPVGMTLALRFNRVELRRAIQTDTLDALPLRLSYVAFFGAGVRDKWIWYDVVETMRKLVLTALIKLLTPKLSSSAVPIADDALPLGLASVVALIFTGVYAYARPLALRSSNLLLVYCNAALVCAMQLALLSRAYSADDNGTSGPSSLHTSRAFHTLSLLVAFSVIPATLVALVWQHMKEEAVHAPEWVARKLRREHKSFRMPRRGTGGAGEAEGEEELEYEPPSELDNPLNVALIARHSEGKGQG